MDKNIDMACIPCEKTEQPQHFYENFYEDNRGIFYPLNLKNTTDKVLNKEWIQNNISINPKKYTFRGLHYQKNSFAQSKHIIVLQGAIIDFMINIREDDPEQGKVHYFAMEEGNSVYCPKGFAHGFITIEPNTIVQYLVDTPYEPEQEGCIFWNSIPIIKEIINTIDPRFSSDRIIISEKDQKSK